MDIVFATKNRGKMKEIREIMQDTGYNVVSMEDIGIDIDVVEDGETFEHNAMKKAVEIMQVCGKIVLSDDSGIEIDYLDKMPGVYSARYLGVDTPYSVKNRKVLDLLKEVPDEKRTARFVSVIAAAIPEMGGIEARQFTVRGEVEGIIAHESKGENGFGYDPIFFVPAYGMTTAEMGGDLKNEISHRGIALRMMKDKLSGILSK